MQFEQKGYTCRVYQTAECGPLNGFNMLRGTVSSYDFLCFNPPQPVNGRFNMFRGILTLKAKGLKWLCCNVPTCRMQTRLHKGDNHQCGSHVCSCIRFSRFPGFLVAQFLSSFNEKWRKKQCLSLVFSFSRCIDSFSSCSFSPLSCTFPQNWPLYV